MNDPDRTKMGFPSQQRDAPRRLARSRHRFSGSPYERWLMFGVALLTAVVTYWLVEGSFLTEGRYGQAAILAVIGMPLLVVILLHGPITRALDWLLDRAARRS
ncbi:MAG: hypothetical protein R3F49_21280 [Planctomycetota bacterium]